MDFWTKKKELTTPKSSTPIFFLRLGLPDLITRPVDAKTPERPSRLLLIIQASISAICDGRFHHPVRLPGVVGKCDLPLFQHSRNN